MLGAISAGAPLKAIVKELGVGPGTVARLAARLHRAPDAKSVDVPAGDVLSPDEAARPVPHCSRARRENTSPHGEAERRRRAAVAERVQALLDSIGYVKPADPIIIPEPPTLPKLPFGGRMGKLRRGRRKKREIAE